MSWKVRATGCLSFVLAYIVITCFRRNPVLLRTLCKLAWLFIDSETPRVQSRTALHCTEYGAVAAAEYNRSSRTLARIKHGLLSVGIYGCINAFNCLFNEQALSIKSLVQNAPINETYKLSAFNNFVTSLTKVARRIS